MKKIPVAILLTSVFSFFACSSRCKTSVYLDAYQRQYENISGIFRGELLEQQLLYKGEDSALYADISAVLIFCDHVDSLTSSPRILSEQEFFLVGERHRTLKENMQEIFLEYRLPVPVMSFPAFDKEDTENMQMLKLKQMNLDMLQFALNHVSVQTGQYPFEVYAYRYPEPRIADIFIEKDTLNLSFVYGTSSGLFRPKGLDSLIMYEVSGKQRHEKFRLNVYGQAGFHVLPTDSITRIGYMHYVTENDKKGTKYEMAFK